MNLKEILKKYRQKIKENNKDFFRKYKKKIGCNKCYEGKVIETFDIGAYGWSRSYRCNECTYVKRKKYIDYLKIREKLKEIMTAKEFEKLDNMWWDNNEYIDEETHWDDFYEG